MRGDKCRYSHKYSKKGQKVQAHKIYGNDSKKIEVNDSRDSKDEVVEQNTNKKRKYDDKDTSLAIESNDIDNITNDLASKDEQINTITEEATTLKSENPNLKKEVEKLMRVARNMHNEIKNTQRRVSLRK